ncbi:hypothetical protein [Streptomyces sp. NPDC098781]|uniref:hypothetical protein n=1 Tax=Streptomyces sp. NPDC098781 TaxID=3366097 RepID=UPI0038304303
MTDATTGRGAGHEPVENGPVVPPTGGAARGATPSRGTTPGGIAKESVTTPARATEESVTRPRGITKESGREAGRLVPHEESDKFELKLQHAVSGFVDGPRAAVEEADRVVEDLLSRFTETIGERRRTLRRSWQDTDERADTEQLRLALRDYRELAERLLHI